MGIIHKLKSEIREFILEEKKNQPVLSCRSLTGRVENRFQIKISKSSINSIIKKAGLSQPVGRRLKKRRYSKPEALLEFKPEEISTKIELPLEVTIKVPVEVLVEPESTGIILLKAVDYLIGGSRYIAEAVKSRLNLQEKDLLSKIEGLIYLSLYKRPEADKLTYLNELQSVRTLYLDILRIISSLLQEVRCTKVNFSDGSAIYIDGQMYTVWSTPHIPHNFYTTLYNTKTCINRYFLEDKPLVLFMAPGYETPTPDFFNFILSLDSKVSSITGFTFYDHRFTELETIHSSQTKKRYFIFGLWPWQFLEYRKVNKIEEFKAFHFEPLNKDFFLAEIEVLLSQPNVKQEVTLKGLALKTGPKDKIRLIILSNIPSEAIKPEELANTYLSHWPNLEETFQDFSRKIEVLTYMGDTGDCFSSIKQGLSEDISSDIKELFNQYIKALDSYVKGHFLPSAYENKEFSLIRERFYNLRVVLENKTNYILAVFRPTPGYPFLKELEYCLRRLNEREIINLEGKRMFFSV
jgi:hypothetical protein